MKELEIDLPKSDDTGVIARVKRLHFYSVREDFITVWKHHEQLLLDYEERVKSTIQRHARIGNHMLWISLNQWQTSQINNWSIYLIQFSVDAAYTEEETEALIANNNTSIFVGNVSLWKWLENEPKFFGKIFIVEILLIQIN